MSASRSAERTLAAQARPNPAPPVAGATLPRRIWLLTGIASLAAVGFALYSQHRLGMQPCPWCILQRVIFIAIGLLCLLAALCPTDRGAFSRRATRALATPVLLLALAGAAAALYQNLVASKSASCNLTLADRIVASLGLDTQWPEVFEVRASCADAAVKLLGIPYEVWSLMLFAALGAIAALAWRRPTR
jgi:disulfide bond formation protein DsbB